MVSVGVMEVMIGYVVVAMGRKYFRTMKRTTTLQHDMRCRMVVVGSSNKMY